MVWALCASAAVHAGAVAVSTLRQANTPGAAPSPAIVLQASLALARALPQPVMTVDAPAPIAMPVAPQMLMPVLVPLERIGLTHEPLAVASAAIDGGFEDVRVAGALLEDRARLGDLYGRQLVEFPREIDTPARTVEKIFAQYPPEALAARIEGSVAVWAIVDETGTPVDVEAADGPPELAQSAVQAVRRARFIPARNRMQPIRFPIALEFRFTAGEHSALAANRSS